VSKISRLDQYYQFTLAGAARERFERLLPALSHVSGQTTLFDMQPEARW